MSAAARLLSTAEAADLLGIHQNTLRLWRSKKRGPAYVKFSQTEVKYDIRDIEQWIADHKRGGGDGR